MNISFLCLYLHHLFISAMATSNNLTVPDPYVVSPIGRRVPKMIWLFWERKPVVCIRQGNSRTFDFYYVNTTMMNVVGENRYCECWKTCNCSFLHVRDMTGSIMHVSPLALTKLATTQQL